MYGFFTVMSQVQKISIMFPKNTKKNNIARKH
jgi:hypothetical protein